MSCNEVAILKEWLLKKGQLPENIDEYCLAVYVTVAKGSIQKAKQRLENGYIFRYKLEFGYDISWDPFSNEMINMINRVAIIMLPKKTPDGYMVLMTAVKEGPPDPNFLMKYVMMWQYYLCTLMWDQALGDCQVVLCIDWLNVSLSDMKAASPSFVALLTKSLQISAPLRVKATIHVSFNNFLQWVSKSLNTLFDSKMKDRRLLLSHRKDLRKHIPKEILPSEYEGDEASVFEIYEATTKQRFYAYREKLIAVKQVIASDKPLVSSHLNENDYDTFRKLNID